MTDHKIKIDPEFKALIPPLAPEELDQLEANLAIDGCRDALVLWRGILLDGHNRHSICIRRGIEYRTISIDLKDRNAALLWIIDNQKGRRNVSDIDRISLARKREEIEQIVNAEKQRSGKGSDGSGGRGKKKTLPQNCGKVSRHEKESSARAAKSAGVGQRTYDAGKLILDAAAKGEIKPEVVEDVRRGRAAIHRVAKDIKETRQKSARKQKRLEAVEAAPSMDERIIVGDFRTDSYDLVADGSVSLIFTDPPYDREASKMLPELARFAAAKLADGGSLICYVGQTQLPAAMDAFRAELRYWWTICCLHSGGATVMREYGINAGWKAVLWFVKKTRDDNSVFVSDVMSGGREKDQHDWQQSQSEAEYWIEKLCPKDGIVCDPFLGGGTTAAAAEKLSRKWIGFEIDADTAAIAAQRVT